jgi:hypothetical protein
MKLVTFGDSWPAGAEIEDSYTKTYGYLLASRVDAEFYNYGRGGASLDELVTQLEDFVTRHYDPNQKTIALFFLTNPARSHYWPHDMDWLTYTWKIKEFKELFLHFHSHNMQRASISVSACQTWCKQLGIDDYYFAGWNRQTEWMPFVNTDKIWKGGNETAADWLGAISQHTNSEYLFDVRDNIYFKPNFCHPNELGHELIAEKLYNWIYK